jgi:probable rRNA maturation factor
MIHVLTKGRLPSGIQELDLLQACLIATRLAKRETVGQVGISFVSDAEMQKLNRMYRKKNKTTDVLSFPEPEIPGKRQSWGDIFVSTTYVRGEAKRRGIALQEEVLRVVIHGMLHLMGYDHVTDEEETAMFTLQEKALAKLVDL